jgi:hypothetical protein
MPFLLFKGLCLRHLYLITPSSLCLWLGLHGVLSPAAPASPASPSSRPLVLSGSLIRCELVQVYHHHPAFPFGGGKTSCSGRCSYISGSYSLCHFFFHFGGGQPHHSVLTLIFWILAIFFVISNPRVSLKVSLTFPMLFSRSCCLLLHPMMPLAVVLSFLRCICRIASRSLIPLMPFSFAWRLFPNVILSGFFLQHCVCLVPDDRVPCVVQEWHGGSSLCRRRPTSSGTHHCSGSVSLVVGCTLRLDARPHTASSVLWQFSLWPLL